LLIGPEAELKGTLPASLPRPVSVTVSSSTPPSVVTSPLFVTPPEAVKETLPEEVTPPVNAKFLPEEVLMSPELVIV